MSADLDISLTVNGKDYFGWLDAQVERSIEQLSGRFSVSISAGLNELPIKRQDEVVVNIAGLPVISGYCLQSDPFYSRTDYGRKVAGRDKCGDLAAASAIFGNGQWVGVGLDKIAKDLCKPFKILVRIDADVMNETVKPFERFEIEAGETVAACLARACSYRGVLVTRDNSQKNQGGVYICRAGKDKAPAAIVSGGNVIAMEPMGNDNQRFAEYHLRGQDEFNLYDSSDGAAGIEAIAKDGHIKRYLPLVVNADTGGDRDQLQARADHQARVRHGNAFAYKYTLDSWSVDGVPWAPNTRVSVYDPALGLNGEEWLIVSTMQRVNREDGDVCDVVIKPIAAFDEMAIPEPEVLV